MIALLLACGEPEPASPEPGSTDSPDIVVLVASGLRADAAEKGAEAELYRAMRRYPSTRFTAAYAQSCLPHTSFGSLLTGRYPSGIPLCGPQSGIEPTRSQGEPWCATLPAGTVGVARVAEAQGYSTGAYVADVMLDFETNWNEVYDVAEAWWRDHEPPRLYLVQVSDIHLAQHRPSMALHGEEGQPPRADPDRIAADYLQVTRSVGEGLGALLERMPSENRWVFLTSTNGLSLAEAGGVGSDAAGAVTHAVVVDRTVRVPLAVLEPRSGAGEVHRVVELIDLVPTVAELAGGVPPAGVTGHSLLSEVPDPRPYAYAEFGDTLALREGDELLSMRGLRDGASSLDPRLTERLLGEGVDSGSYTLHDVETDPFQTTDLLDQRLERAEELRRLMIEVRTGPAAPPAEDSAGIEAPRSAVR